MILTPPKYDPDAPIIVIDVGNTSTKLATFHGGRLKTPLASPTFDAAAFEEAFDAHFSAAAHGRPAATIISSVVPDQLERIRLFTLAKTDQEALVVGESIDLPMDVSVADAKAIGVDRVCTAAASYEKLQRGCTVVSFGSAVTVDLVDDDGVLIGGAILPGLRMQLRALHEFTAKLPLVEPGVPDSAFGRNTIEALQIGVYRGLSGAVRALVESYAAHLNRWPQVVATGGDAPFLAPHCDFLDTVVADLTLRGIALAYEKFLAGKGV